MSSITIPTLTAHPINGGFGDHSNPGTLREVLKAEEQKDNYVGLMLGSVVLSISSGCTWAFCMSTGVFAAYASPFLTAAGLTAGFAAVFSIFCVYSVLAYKREQMRAAGVFNSRDQLRDLRQDRNRLYDGKVTAIAMSNTVDTHRMRIKMIEAANSTIVISGNYCGGVCFNETLDAISKRMRQKRSVRTVILSSPHFISRPNLRKLRQIERAFPGRFEMIYTDVLWHVDPGLKKSTNHTKATIVDGKYGIFGGSGIEDKYASNDGVSPYIPPRPRPGEGFIEKMIARRFRDQDWAFRSDSPVITDGLIDSQLLYATRQILRLGIRNLSLSRMERSPHTFWRQRRGRVRSLAMDLLQESFDSKRVREGAEKTKVNMFDRARKKVAGVTMQLFASGPEHSKSPFVEQLINDIHRARDEICISTLYFHPPAELMNALIDAARRGVMIKIITNGWTKNSPYVHRLFGPRNRYHAYYLASSLPPRLRGNFKLYEFSETKTTFHKKVAVVDNVVYAGSGNWGYKSMISTSDWELNFRAESATLARNTKRVFRQDQRHSELVTYPEDISLGTIFRTINHRMWAPIIG